MPCSLVVFSFGYGLDSLKKVGWLADTAIHYWGDIDNHGFAMLDWLRCYYPHARSLLMDRPTLLAHERYETLSMQAAALFPSLCQNHCFVDGNKRVAFAATAIYLRMNGYRLRVKVDDGEKFLVDQIIQQKVAIDDIATWLEDRMESVDA